MKLKEMTPELRELHIVNALKSHWGYDTQEAKAVLAVHEANLMALAHKEVIAITMRPGPYRRLRSNTKWREGVLEAVTVLFSRQGRLLARFDVAQLKQRERELGEEQVLKNTSST